MSIIGTKTDSRLQLGQVQMLNFYAGQDEFGGFFIPVIERPLIIAAVRTIMKSGAARIGWARRGPRQLRKKIHDLNSYAQHAFENLASMFLVNRSTPQYKLYRLVSDHLTSAKAVISAYAGSDVLTPQTPSLVVSMSVLRVFISCNTQSDSDATGYGVSEESVRNFIDKHKLSWLYHGALDPIESVWGDTHILRLSGEVFICRHSVLKDVTSAHSNYIIEPLVDYGVSGLIIAYDVSTPVGQVQFIRRLAGYHLAREVSVAKDVVVSYWGVSGAAFRAAHEGHGDQAGIHIAKVLTSASVATAISLQAKTALAMVPYGEVFHMGNLLAQMPCVTSASHFIRFYA